jgi:hypothetical protein
MRSLLHFNESEGDELRKKWYESGRWYGKYMKEKFKDPVDSLRRLLKATRWDLDEVEVKQNGDAVKIRCVSTVMTPEGTEMLLGFIEGAMHAQGSFDLGDDRLLPKLMEELSPSLGSSPTLTGWWRSWREQVQAEGGRQRGPDPGPE